MKKYKYLIKNVGVLTISNFGSKVLSFLLIPLYTSVLTTSEYGTYDIFQSTISLCVPILSVSISSAMLRFLMDFLEDKTKTTETISIGIKYIIFSIFAFSLLIGINYIFEINTEFKKYSLLIIFMYASYLIYEFLSNIARGRDKITLTAISGIINSIVLLGSNILFLVVFKFGLKGYIVAYCLGNIMPALFIAIALKLWRYISFKPINKSLRKELISYSRPLIVDIISWWITNISARYVILAFCGAGANGIYSVSYKIPSILNIFQGIFNQAWTLSAVKEYNEKTTDFCSEIYNLYNCGMVFVCSVLLIANKLIAKILFANEFFEAWRYAPYLMVSVVFGAMCGVLGGMFSASKNSRTKGMSTLIGAIVNLACCIVLVYKIGPLGASISALLSYIAVWATRIIKIKKEFDLKINLKRDIFVYFILIIQATVLIFELPLQYELIIEIALLFIIFIMYYKIIIGYLKKLKVKI